MFRLLVYLLQFSVIQAFVFLALFACTISSNKRMFGIRLPFYLLSISLFLWTSRICIPLPEILQNMTRVEVQRVDISKYFLHTQERSQIHFVARRMEDSLDVCPDDQYTFDVPFDGNVWKCFVTDSAVGNIAQTTVNTPILPPPAAMSSFKTLSSQCMLNLRQGDYWIIELCWGRFIRQLHIENVEGTGGAAPTQRVDVVVLGLGPDAYAPFPTGGPTPVVAGPSPGGDLPASPTSDGVMTPELVDGATVWRGALLDGYVCRPQPPADTTDQAAGKPRRVDITGRCPTGGAHGDAILHLTEPAMCAYHLLIVHPDFCQSHEQPSTAPIAATVVPRPICFNDKATRLPSLGGGHVGGAARQERSFASHFETPLPLYVPITNARERDPLPPSAQCFQAE